MNVPSVRKIRIVHLAWIWRADGTERILRGLLAMSNRDQFEHIIVSCIDENPRIADIRENLQITCKAIDISPGKFHPINIIRSFFWVRKLKPDIIKCWFPLGNILGGIFARLIGVKVIWGIHNDQPIGEFRSPLARYQLPLSRILPHAIVCCSRSVENLYRKMGCPPELLKTITNGVDADRFTYTAAGRMRYRQRLGIEEGALVIGMAAQFSSNKRQRYFLTAARIFLDAYPQARFLLCGCSVNDQNTYLKTHIDFLGLHSQVRLLGMIDDLPEFYSALDINSLVSCHESFGLAVAEAMSCEIPCVGTDVGIMNDLLDQVGLVIPVSEDPRILANAWKTIVELPLPERSARVKRGRKRIAEDFSQSQMAAAYDTLIRHIASHSHSSSHTIN